MKFLIFTVILGGLGWAAYTIWNYLATSSGTGIGGTLINSPLSGGSGFGKTVNGIAIGTVKTIDGYQAVWDGSEWEFLGPNGLPQ